MKTTRSKWCILFFVFVLSIMAVTGCSKEDKSSENEVEPVIYPISIDGAEIRIGETNMQALLDKGLKVTVSEMTADKQINQYEIDPNEMLEANSYYSGGSVWLTDSTFAHISMVTDEENITMGDAVIAYIEINISSTDKSGLDNILFNGVPITEITREKAGEMFPDFTGDENMWFSPVDMNLAGYEYFMAFDTSGSMIKVSAKKSYDVDWNSKN